MKHIYFTHAKVMGKNTFVFVWLIFIYMNRQRLRVLEMCVSTKFTQVLS